MPSTTDPVHGSGEFVQPSFEPPMYYQCPDCGFKQKSQAMKRIKCHRCDRSYLRRKAKQVEKTPDAEKGLGFFTYTEED